MRGCLGIAAVLFAIFMWFVGIPVLRHSYQAGIVERNNRALFEQECEELGPTINNLNAPIRNIWWSTIHPKTWRTPPERLRPDQRGSLLAASIMGAFDALVMFELDFVEFDLLLWDDDWVDMPEDAPVLQIRLLSRREGEWPESCERLVRHYQPRFGSYDRDDLTAYLDTLGVDGTTHCIGVSFNSHSEADQIIRLQTGGVELRSSDEGREVKLYTLGVMSSDIFPLREYAGRERRISLRPPSNERPGRRDDREYLVRWQYVQFGAGRTHSPGTEVCYQQPRIEWNEMFELRSN